VDVAGKMQNPKEEQTASLDRNGYTLVVRKDGKTEEWPYSGFSKSLVGMQIEESKVFKHKYSKDDPDESLRGETVDFTVTLKSVRSMTLPELNDDFAKMTGQYDTLEQLTEALSKDLEARSKSQYEDEYYLQLLDKIRGGATVKYPPQMVEQEAEQVVDNMRQRLAQQGLDLDTYFKIRETDMEKFLEEEARPVAVERLERSLILDNLAKEEKIEMDESALQSEFGQTMSALQSQGLDLSNVKGGKRGQQQVAEAVAMESANRLITRHTLERIKAIATGELETEGKDAKPKTKPKSQKSGASKASGKNASKTRSSKSREAKSSGTKPTSRKPKAKTDAK
jgi:trigger factor